MTKRTYPDEELALAAVSLLRFVAANDKQLATEWRMILCHSPKHKAHMVAECPFDEIANLMYHLYLVGAWDD